MFHYRKYLHIEADYGVVVLLQNLLVLNLVDSFMLKAKALIMVVGNNCNQSSGRAVGYKGPRVMERHR